MDDTSSEPSVRRPVTVVAALIVFWRAPLAVEFGCGAAQPAATPAAASPAAPIRNWRRGVTRWRRGHSLSCRSDIEATLGHLLDDRWIAVIEEQTRGGIHGGDPIHLVGREFEVKDGEVLPHPVRSNRFRNHGDVTLDEPAASRQRLKPVIHQVLDSITEAAADVRNERGDIVASNKLGHALYSEIRAETVQPPNVARYTFLNPSARDFFVDWDRAATDVVAVLRATVGRNPYDESLSDLVGEIELNYHSFELPSEPRHAAFCRRLLPTPTPSNNRMTRGSSSTFPEQPGTDRVTVSDSYKTSEAAAR
jgi:MmyB-like transcription regulator ligand binding domain